MVFVFAILALVGHFSISIAIVNRMHGTGLPRSVLRLCDVFWYLFTLGTPWVIGRWYLGLSKAGESLNWQASSTWWVVIYCSLACAATVVALVDRIQRLWINAPQQLTGNHTQRLSISERLGRYPTGDPLTAMLARLPGNEILQLHIHEKRLALPRLDSALDGFTITHLSDLHFTGQITPDYFEQVVEQANLLQSDLIAVTGDIIDKARCLSWIPRLLGQLSAPCGVFFVLGNHELRVRNTPLIRRTLSEAGLTDLGGRWHLIEHAPRPILLAGNELPWHIPAADLRDAPELHNGHRPLRMLLTHTPDQLSWARQHDMDLMLAGHTHGGQVRLPLIGPILSPSLYGSRHASGTFYYAPTLMHVSRGISGTRPFRFNCAPELTQLVLYH